jgi:hypothetical protein
MWSYALVYVHAFVVFNQHLNSLDLHSNLFDWDIMTNSIILGQGISWMVIY